MKRLVINVPEEQYRKLVEAEKSGNPVKALEVSIEGEGQAYHAHLVDKYDAIDQLSEKIEKMRNGLAELKSTVGMKSVNAYLRTYCGCTQTEIDKVLSGVNEYLVYLGIKS